MSNVVSIFFCGRPNRLPCSTCGAPATHQCGAMLKGTRAGHTCDRAVCQRCAAMVDGDIVYCPPHARAAGLGAKTPPAPLMPVLGKVAVR